MSESRKTGIGRLYSLREKAELTAEQMAEGRGRFHALAREDAAPRVVSSFNLFQTPEPLAARLVGMFTSWGRVLEPSAGLGRLYRAVRAATADPVTLVDVSPECCSELYRATEGDQAARLVAGDFLTMDAERLGSFDAIVMNPPFKMGTDIRHVRHALTLLAPGGRLVAIVAAGPRQRAALEPIADQWHDLPAGSFRSEGTDVAAAIVVIDKPTK
jgi:SAM-dependent methyltransferase